MGFEQPRLASWRAGRRELLEDVTGGGKEGSDGWRAYLAANRCGSKARGSVYDTVAGICCHFCRQVRLGRCQNTAWQATFREIITWCRTVGCGGAKGYHRLCQHAVSASY